MARSGRTRRFGGSPIEGHRGGALKQVTGKQLARAVEKLGWTLARIQGSHHVYKKEGRRERVVIPIHGNKPLKIGLLKSQMKIAGITDADL